MKILCIGPLWRGSNAGGLFRALSREQCIVEILDEFYFLSLQTRTPMTKIAERLLRPLQEKEFNNAIKRQVNFFKPDYVLVYKGAFVQPDTLKYAKQHGCKLVLFFPDVSMTFHGSNIPGSIPLYDLIFTTKTFGVKDLAAKFGVKNAFFIPHGFDSDIHRPLAPGPKEQEIFGCDVSFIGTWSAKKEKYLAYLKQHLPAIDLKIWGDQWGKTTSDAIRSSIQGRSVTGDLYALAIQCSKINLGILSEQVAGASSGDLITSRTFHIPAASGLLLHERNEESVLYYRENEEAAFFATPEELAQKVKNLLADEPLREKIRTAGNKRAWAEHSLDARARTIIKELKKL